MRTKPSYREQVNLPTRQRIEHAKLDMLHSIGMIVFWCIVIVLALLASCVAAQAEELCPSTCRIIELNSKTLLSASAGTGVLVAKDATNGFVATAAHVVLNEKDLDARYVVIFPESFGLAYGATSRALPTDETDIALLTIPAPPDIDPRPIAWRAPKVGERVFQSGYGNHTQYPREYWSTVLDNADFTRKSMLRLSRHSRRGDSGGPIIDQQGYLIGITSAGDGSLYQKNTNRVIGRDPYGYHTAIGGQEWIREAIPEISILLDKEQ